MVVEVVEVLVVISNVVLVVVGPTSIHDRQACMEYAARLKALADQLSDELFVVMHVNFEDSAPRRASSNKFHASDALATLPRCAGCAARC